MADSRFALSNQNIVEELKENAKNKNTSRATQTSLNVWQTWATERKLNPKLEKYEHEQLDKMLSGLHTANLSWQTRIGKLKLVCVNGIKTVGKHVSI